MVSDSTDDFPSVSESNVMPFDFSGERNYVSGIIICQILMATGIHFPMNRLSKLLYHRNETFDCV